MSAKTGDNVAQCFYRVAADLAGVVLTKPELEARFKTTPNTPPPAPSPADPDGLAPPPPPSAARPTAGLAQGVLHHHDSRPTTYYLLQVAAKIVKAEIINHPQHEGLGGQVVLPSRKAGKQGGGCSVQ